MVLDSGHPMFDETLRRGRWPLALRLARDFFEHAPPESQLALLLVTNKVEERFDFGERSLALERLRELESGRGKLPGGFRKSAFYDSVLAGIAALGRPRLGDVVYAITNGSEAHARASARQVEEGLLRSGARLFVAAIFSDLVMGRGSESMSTGQQVSDLATNTGGIYFSAITTGIDATRRKLLEIMDWQKFAELLDRVYRHMNEFYALEVELPPQSVGQKWKIELVSTPRRRLDGLELAYPHKVPPCIRFE